MVRRVSCALLMAAMLLPVASVAIAEDLSGHGAPRSQDTDASAVASAIDWRQGFGLRADPAYVARSLDDPVTFPNTDWGIPLSREEVDDLAARLEVQRQLPPAIDFAYGQPAYAGAYIDQRRGGIPVFLFTEISDDIRDGLERWLPEVDFEVHEVSSSLDALTRLKRRISRAREELYEEGIEVVSVSVHVTANNVEVGVIEATDEARARLAEFGAPVVVVEDSLPVLDVTRPDSPFEDLWSPLEAGELSLGYYCDGTPFTAWELASATPATEADATLRGSIEHWGRSLLDADAEWHLVKADRARVLAMAKVGDRVSAMELDRAVSDVFAAETWEFVRGGDCEPVSAAGRGIGGDWQLDPDHPAPGPRARKLHVIGDAGCNGTERRGKAHIDYTPDAALIAIPMGSKVHSDTCHGLGPKRMTITLPKPLGERALYDVGSLPIRQVTPSARD